MFQKPPYLYLFFGVIWLALFLGFTYAKSIDVGTEKNENEQSTALQVYGERIGDVTLDRKKRMDSEMMDVEQICEATATPPVNPPQGLTDSVVFVIKFVNKTVKFAGLGVAIFPNTVVISAHILSMMDLTMGSIWILAGVNDTCDYNNGMRQFLKVERVGISNYWKLKEENEEKAAYEDVSILHLSEPLKMKKYSYLYYGRFRRDAVFMVGWEYSEEGCYRMKTQNLELIDRKNRQTIITRKRNSESKNLISDKHFLFKTIGLISADNKKIGMGSAFTSTGTLVALHSFTFENDQQYHAYLKISTLVNYELCEVQTILGP